MVLGGKSPGEHDALVKSAADFHPNLPDDQLIVCAEDLFGAAGARNREIGGPTDVAVIEPGGVRWLRRKVPAMEVA
jgi:hypothetical protein